MTDLIEIYREARERITDPQCWTTDHYARDNGGDDVPPTSERAVCWCAAGSLRRSLSDHGLVEGAFQHDVPWFIPLREAGGYLVARDHLDYANSYDPDWPVPLVNDVGGHEKALEMFDLAIEELGRG